MPKHTQVLKSLIHFECFVSSFSQRSQASTERKQISLLAS